MKKETKMLKGWRYDKVSQVEKMITHVCLSSEGICIKLDRKFNDSKIKDRCCTVYIYSFTTYIFAMSTLVKHGITSELAVKLRDLLKNWFDLGYYSFPENGGIVVDLDKINNI